MYTVCKIKDIKRLKHFSQLRHNCLLHISRAIWKCCYRLALPRMLYYVENCTPSSRAHRDAKRRLQTDQTVHSENRTAKIEHVVSLPSEVNSFSRELYGHSNLSMAETKKQKRWRTDHIRREVRLKRYQLEISSQKQNQGNKTKTNKKMERHKYQYSANSRCSGRVPISCSACNTRHINHLVKFIKFVQARSNTNRKSCVRQ